MVTNLYPCISNIVTGHSVPVIHHLDPVSGSVRCDTAGRLGDRMCRGDHLRPSHEKKHGPYVVHEVLTAENELSTSEGYVLKGSKLSRIPNRALVSRQSRRGWVRTRFRV